METLYLLYLFVRSLRMLARKDEKDVFVHQTAIQEEGFTLKEGDEVEFEISQGSKIQSHHK